MSAKPKPQRKFWVFVTTYECQLCSRTNTYRERRYGKKPKDPNKRKKEHFDACNDHFM